MLRHSNVLEYKLNCAIVDTRDHFWKNNNERLAFEKKIQK